MLNETSLSGGLNLSAKYENSLDTSLSRQFHRETQTNPIVELTIQIFLTTHRRTSISRYSIVFSLHRLSCSVLVDSLEEGFHVLYLHLDSHHVDPSKYTQHQLPNYCNSFLKSWCSNYKKCVHCSGTGKTTKNIMHASVISDVYFLRP